MKKVLYSFYRIIISPAIHTLAGPSFGCRFVPTCGEYAHEALHEYGWIKGGGLALWRVFRCHPFARAGFDPVPRGIARPYFKPNPDQGR